MAYDGRMSRGRGIVLHPDPVLRMKAKPVAAIDDFVRDLVADMRRVARELDGAGIAAPQLGESVRIFLTCAREEEPERVFINPVLDATGAVCPHDEGCLSLPDIRGTILRPGAARIRALDLEGNEFTLESDGFPARVWQHEYDHLEGVLIIDRMRPIDKLANRRALRDLERAGG
jgi:peptide deformylase